MKKILYSIIALLGVFASSSCGDMLEVDNQNMAVEPELNQKTDSVFYALGIAQAMQQLADQYYFIGEMRGDLVTTNINTDANLKDLSNYSADATNAYDSAYVYYKVINNCNYYLAHRDTTLYTGAINVAIDEYAAVAAYRAWAYLQLARTYGDKIPFFTEPLTSISQINEDNLQKFSLSEIVANLSQDLEKYSAMHVKTPTFGQTSYNIGNPNWTNTNKTINPKKIFVPVDVVLGEMYLEDGQYEKAAQKYCKYLGENQILSESYSSIRSTENLLNRIPEDAVVLSFQITWPDMFTSEANKEYVSYIPMAVSRLRGTTTNIPLAYGYNYYSIDRESSCPRVETIQIQPSQAFYDLTSGSDFYYYNQTAEVQKSKIIENPDSVGIIKIGDGRASYGESRGNANILNHEKGDTAKVYIKKASTANIVLFRNSTVYLHLAEAFNRMGYPDLAFAVLKNGISTYLEDIVNKPTYDLQNNEIPAPEYKYISEASIKLLQTTVPFLTEYRAVFEPELTFGIHQHGAGQINTIRSEGLNQDIVKGSRATSVGSQLNTHYLPKPIITEKLNEIAATFNVAVNYDNELDRITAMELILCDEYAKEFAFEGTRFYDLQRMARHLNESGVFGGNFGSIWFAAKLAGNNPVKDLSDPQNWYLPFK